jgi:AraC-like DNA-binding protein
MISSFHISKVNIFLKYLYNLLLFVFLAEFLTFVYFEQYFGSFYFFIGFFFVLSLKLFIKIKAKEIPSLALFLFLFTAAFLSFPILAYFRHSLSTIMWIFLIPIGISVFYSFKTVLKIFFIILIYCFLLIYIHFQISFMGLNNLSEDHKYYGDFVSIFNITLLGVFFIYKKIKYHNEYISYMKTKEELMVLKRFNELAKKQESLLLDLKKQILDKMLFKNSSFSVFDLSTESGKSYSEINRILKDNQISNFKLFLNQIRIDHIIKAINSEEIKTKTLKAIFTENGFENQSTFNRVFKELIGETPSEYMKKRSIDQFDKSVN